MTAHPDDEARLAEISTDLADRVEEALPGWVERCVVERAAAAGVVVDDRLLEHARGAGRRCRDDVVPALRSLLATDVEEQWGTPLTLLRSAVGYPTEVLESAGVPPVDRDEVDARIFPEDPYDLVPRSFSDVDESLREPGLMWGAAKAHVHLARRRPGTD